MLNQKSGTIADQVHVQGRKLQTKDHVILLTYCINCVVWYIKYIGKYIPVLRSLSMDVSMLTLITSWLHMFQTYEAQNYIYNAYWHSRAQMIIAKHIRFLGKT